MTGVTSDGDCSRRTILKRGVLASTALVGLAGCAESYVGSGTETGGSNGDAEDGTGGSDGSRVYNRFVIPRVEGYQDDYVGRILSIESQTTADTAGVPIGECGFANWPPDRTQTYRAQFLDKRKSPPASVPVTVYSRPAGDPIDPDAHFIIGSVSQCPGKYVGVSVEWFVRRSSVGPRR